MLSRLGMAALAVAGTLVGVVRELAARGDDVHIQYDLGETPSQAGCMGRQANACLHAVPLRALSALRLF